MGILLAVLKIIGVILLIVLALAATLLLLLIIVLSAPIVYTAQIKKHKAVSINFTGHWLWKLLTFSYRRNEKGATRLQIKLLGKAMVGGSRRADRNKGSKRRHSKNEREQPEASAGNDKANDTESDSGLESSPSTDSVSSSESSPSTDSVSSSESSPSTDSVSSSGSSPDANSVSSSESSPDANSVSGSGSSPDANSVSGSGLDGTDAEQSDEDEQSDKKGGFDYKAVLDYPHKQQVVNAVLKLVKRLYRTLKPKHFSLNAKIGFDDPSLTGRIVGYSFLFAGITGFDINVSGEFDKSMLEFDALIKGRFTILRILFVIILFALTKPIFKLIIKQIKGRKKKRWRLVSALHSIFCLQRWKTLFQPKP